MPTVSTYYIYLKQRQCPTHIFFTVTIIIVKLQIMRRGNQDEGGGSDTAVASPDLPCQVIDGLHGVNVLLVEHKSGVHLSLGPRRCVSPLGTGRWGGTALLQ